MSDDEDPEILISRLSGPLAGPDRVSFRRAAETALAQIPCAGPGSVYRAIAQLQRAYFRPPTERATAWDIGHELPSFRTSKLVNRPAIAAAEQPQAIGRRRSMWARR
jgi:hypothetical protein